jgi:hypothetical protein
MLQLRAPAQVTLLQLPGVWHDTLQSEPAAHWTNPSAGHPALPRQDTSQLNPLGQVTKLPQGAASLHVMTQVSLRQTPFTL